MARTMSILSSFAVATWSGLQRQEIRRVGTGTRLSVFINVVVGEEEPPAL